MSKELKNEIREALSRSTRPTPDLQSVISRGRTLRGRRRGAAMVAGTAGVALIVLGASAVLPLERKASPRPPAAPPAQKQPPEGALLVQSGGYATLFEHGRRPVRLQDLLSLDISDDASKIVAVGDSGGRQTLVQVDVADGSRSQLAAAEAGDSFDPPILWSPNGSHVAYRYSAGGAETDPPVEQSLCVLTVATTNSDCFSGLGEIYWFDWAPDGGRLVAAGPTGTDMILVDAATGSSTVLVPADDPDVKAAIVDAGLPEPTDYQFVEPSFSASGGHIAVSVMSRSAAGWDGNVPMVFTAAGEFVQSGVVSRDVQSLSWSPVDELLAYSSAAPGSNDGDCSQPAVNLCAAYVLDPVTGEQTLITSRDDVQNVEGETDPLILEVAWSPSGDSVALSGRETIVLGNPSGGVSGELDVYRRFVPTTLVDWEG